MPSWHGQEEFYLYLSHLMALALFTVSNICHIHITHDNKFFPPLHNEISLYCIPSLLSRQLDSYEVISTDTTIINITILEYMATCFNLHFSHLLVSILHKINYNCNLYVDRLRYQPLLKR
jgi:hypothetical protein